MLLFFSNYDPPLKDYAQVSHFWSLCVEVHFYLLIGILVAIGGQRSLLLLPFFAGGVTLWRVWTGCYISINTHLRVDEILSGATLALIFAGAFDQPIVSWTKRLFAIPVLAGVTGFAICCHPCSGPCQYMRPYFATLVVGCTLFHTGWYSSILESRPFAYIASISYALYVVHPASMIGWLGSGDTIVRYMKRPLCFLLTFAVAHWSTFYFEMPLTQVGRNIARRFQQ